MGEQSNGRRVNSNRRERPPISIRVRSPVLGRPHTAREVLKIRDAVAITLSAFVDPDEPSLRWRARCAIQGRSDDVLAEEVRGSERVRRLLSERGDDGTIPLHPYAKWRGAHWVLAVLAE